MEYNKSSLHLSRLTTGKKKVSEEFKVSLKHNFPHFIEKFKQKKNQKGGAPERETNPEIKINKSK